VNAEDGQRGEDFICCLVIHGIIIKVITNNPAPVSPVSVER
jgi:hypothetical protein